MKKPYKLLLMLIAAIVGIWLTAGFLLPVGLPFLFGYGLCCLAERPALFLCRKAGLPRWLSSLICVALVFLLVGSVLFLLGKILFLRLEELAQRLPDFLKALDEPVSELYDRLIGFTSRLPDSFAPAARQWLQRLFEGSSVIVESISQWLLGLVGRILSYLPGIFLFLLAVLLSAYLFSSRRAFLRQMWEKHVPQDWRQKLQMVKKRFKIAIGGYVKAQLRLCAVTLGILTLGLLLLKGVRAVPMALLIAFIDALPVFGSGVILIPWGVISFLQGSVGTALGLLLLYAAAAVARAFLEPRFLGKQMGLDPILTLLCLYGGFRLFGVGGMILLPIAAILLKQLYELLMPKSA